MLHPNKGINPERKGHCIQEIRGPWYERDGEKSKDNGERISLDDTYAPVQPREEMADISPQIEGAHGQTLPQNKGSWQIA